MSLTISRLVWQYNIKGQYKYVLIALADYADKDGYCYAAIKHLAFKCGIGRSTTIRQLQWLSQHGFLEVVHQYRRNGTRACNAYRVKVVEATQPCPSLAKQSIKVIPDKLSDWDGNYINDHYNDHKNVLDPDLGLNENCNHGHKSALKGAI